MILTEAERKHLSNPVWRLNNLYWVINENGKAVKFKMRVAQRKLLRNMAFRNIILKGRQLGFSTFIQLYILDCILFIPNLRAAIIAHTKEDMATIYRDKIIFAYDHLPPEIRAEHPAKKKDAGELLLENNSGVRVTTSARGTTAQLLHVSELGRIGAKYPQKAKEIIKGCIPAVHEGGIAFFESTAEGQEGVFYDMCQQAINRCAMDRPLSPLEFKMHFFPWYEKPTNKTSPKYIVVPVRLQEYFKSVQAVLRVKFTPEQMAWYTVTEGILGEDMKAENPSTPEEAFEVSIEGAYYKRQMDKMYAENRVGEFPYNPKYSVDTAWDIGHGDATAIWFRQKIGRWNNIIDYMEASGEDLPYFVERLKEKPYTYGRMIAPHDMGNMIWGTGHTVLETALLDHGISFEIAPNIPIQDGIQAVRAMLGKTRINEATCEGLLKVVTSYRKDWNPQMGCWKSAPRHDNNSNGSDAGRYLAVSEPGAGKKKGKPKQESPLKGCAT